MRFLAAALLLVSSSCSSTPSQAQGVQPGPAIDPAANPAVNAPVNPATDEHRWLLQLVGDWEAVIEAAAEPGAAPAQWSSTESVSALGSHWVVAHGLMPGGDEMFKSMMTLGYDSAQQAFVGTWVDSIQTTLWTYRGQLDQQRRVLTLEAVGPSMSDPTKTTRYRDQLELIDANHKTMTSSALGEDGRWQWFMTARYSRKE